MKALKISFLIIAISVITVSCNDKPSDEVAGTYTGSMEAHYNDFDTLNSSSYQVTVEKLDKNNIKVYGEHFDDFEVLVTWNGINVEPVNPDDPNLTTFIYVGDENKLKFTYTVDENTAEFLGTK